MEVSPEIQARLEQITRLPTAARIGIVVSVVVISEVAMSREVFLSGYNWYHLP